MEVLLESEQEEAAIPVSKSEALIAEEEHEKEKDREITFAAWSLCLILLGMILLCPLCALLMGPFLK